MAIAQTEFNIELASEQETVQFAKKLSRMTGPGDVIALYGDLGAGKSVLARAFIRAHMDDDIEVPSPTFTLLQTYDADEMVLYHFDLYRLKVPEEALELGIDDAFHDGLSIIEWPDRLGGYLPRDRLDITLVQGSLSEARTARLVGRGYWSARVSEVITGAAIHG